MKETIRTIREKLEDFMAGSDDNYFSTDINTLYSILINSYPKVPDGECPLTDLQRYSHKFSGADNENEKRKYYQLLLGSLTVLETNAKQAGAL